MVSRKKTKKAISTHTITILLAIVILMGGVWYYFRPTSTPSSDLTPTPTPTQTPSPAPTPTPTPKPTPKPAYVSGFNFKLDTNTYWVYNWTFELSTVSQGSSGNNEKYSGIFTIILGESTEIDGITAYKIYTVGDFSDPEFEYHPRWTHLAIHENQLLGSDDHGATLKVIFDAQNGEWQGGGFFLDYPNDIKMKIYSTQIDNEYLQTSAYTIGQLKSEGGGTYYPSLGKTIYPSDESFTIIEYEYYKKGLGPVGCSLYKSYSSSGGGFFTSTTRQRNVGLVDSSLSADDHYVLKNKGELSPFSHITLNFRGYYADINKEYLPTGPGIFLVYTCRYYSEENTVDLNHLIYIGEAESIRDEIINHKERDCWLDAAEEGETLCYSYAPTVRTIRKCAISYLIYWCKPTCNENLEDYCDDIVTLECLGDCYNVEQIILISKMRHSLESK